MNKILLAGLAVVVIIVIAIAVFALVIVPLGLTTTVNLGPRAQPNSCRVYRPFGPGNTSDMTLEGACSGELPEYVALFGGSSNIQITNTALLPSGYTARSVFAWVYLGSNQKSAAIFSLGTLNNSDGAFLVNASGRLVFQLGSNQYYASGQQSVATGSWYFIGYTYDPASGALTFFVNGRQVGETSNVGPLNTTVSSASIGSWGASDYFVDSLADVQVYNATLNSTAVQTLYTEGIGGAPIALNELAGWWPLNGDTNDYSGNNQNGMSTNIIFNSTWTKAYTTP